MMKSLRVFPNPRFRTSYLKSFELLVKSADSRMRNCGVSSRNWKCYYTFWMTLIFTKVRESVYYIWINLIAAFRN